MSFNRIRRLKSFLTICDEEMIGREIFSSRQVKPGKPRINAYLSRSLEDGISVSRLEGAPVYLFHNLGRLHGKNRNQKYYGMATVPAKKIRRKANNVKYKEVRPDITLENPFHANIWLPADVDKDYAILCAHNLCDGEGTGFIEN